MSSQPGGPEALAAAADAADAAAVTTAPPPFQRQLACSHVELILVYHRVALASVALEGRVEDEVADVGSVDAGKPAGRGGGKVGKPVAFWRRERNLIHTHTHTDTQGHHQLSSPLHLVGVSAVLVASFHELAPHRVELLMVGAQQLGVPLPQALPLQGGSGAGMRDECGG